MAKMKVNFSNKVILVTGASAGIGEATAILFAKYGAKLALVGTNEARLRKVAKRCEKEKCKKPLRIVADLSTDEGCERTAASTLKHYGRLDVLVNNAAIGAMATIQTTDMAVFDRIFNLDIRGVYNLTRLLVPALIKAKGNIVNVSSIAATVTHVGSLPYDMAKAALDHFSKLIALELAPKGVRVNTVRPGITISKFEQRITNVSDAEYEKWLKVIQPVVPLNKLCTGEDIGKMILHVASDNSALVSGATITVDGGLQFAAISDDVEETLQLGQ